ncbi:MAG TPA: PilZ domain-containing protein, partial [Candidatus Margulisiibacteriota bacterium]|nr:PilZ domain-containing protein [Candidatus Margulisiibacteriota bacterium]
SRFQVQIPVHYSAPASESEEIFKTHDISSDGLGILSKRQFPVGTKLDICIQIIDSKEELPVKAVVVWNDHNDRSGLRIEGKKIKPIPLVLRTIEVQMRHL